jgi:hypothetical protein
MRRVAAGLVILGYQALAGAACVRHQSVPKSAAGDACACRGHAPSGLDPQRLCKAWSDETAGTHARSHVSFPELDGASCFVRVRYDGKLVPTVDPTPAGCGYPGPATRARLDHEIARYEAVAVGKVSPTDLPLEIACALPENERRRAARINGATLRALRARIAARSWPYAAVATFGYGARAQTGSGLYAFRPGDGCPTISIEQLGLLQPNVTRAGRAAQAFHAGVAPVVIVSGGAIHAPLYESWILHYLASCRFGVPTDAIVVDPCAAHTHENVRNTASLVVALGGRTSYVVTDGLQAGYLQEWTAFDLIGGSIDQRSLRDFGYLPAAYRQASVGARFGFWLTPYRFWAEPHDGLGGFTCVREVTP